MDEERSNKYNDLREALLLVAKLVNQRGEEVFSKNGVLYVKENPPTVGTALMVQKVEGDEEMEGDLESWKQQTSVNLDHLRKEQGTEFQLAFGEFSALFQQKPGKTHVLKYTLHLKDPTLI
ncbi:hypothetical protein AAFF_G00397420 [Aldrovandia affinis]|uniref:Uncharacterized protein n=1 Tax=Aldrovandia affinis TaxID=143900 RepID=A0AAD7SD31_9TELE|nr:hypothetical protein AAFF_G00397420 [Aldrovandia affinis]